MIPLGHTTKQSRCRVLIPDSIEFTRIAPHPPSAGLLLVGLLLALLPAVAAGQAPEPDGTVPLRVFQPGHEDAVTAILAPHSSDDLVIVGCALRGVHPGPECEISFRFERLDGAGRFDALVRPSLHGTTGSFSFHYEGPAAVIPAGFKGPFETLLRSNDPGDFFEKHCRILQTSTGDDNYGDHNPSRDLLRFLEEKPSSFFTDGIWWVALRILLSLGLALGAALHLRAESPKNDPDTTGPPPSVSGDSRWLFFVLTAAVGLRGVLIFFAPTNLLETEHFPGSDLLGNLFSRVTFMTPWGTLPVADDYHMPLTRAVLGPWCRLGDVLGIGGHLVWLRIPTLALSAWFMMSLLRMARWLRVPSAGRGAALLFAFTPQLVELSLRMGHAFSEMVLTAWFLERLLSVLAGRRPHHTSLAVSAAAALWNGNISGVVVIPGFLAFFVVSLLRGQRRPALATSLLFLALYAPVIETAFDQFVSYSGVSVSGEISEDKETRLEFTHKHGVLYVDGSLAGFVRFPYDVYLHLFGALPALLLAAGMALALIRRPRDTVPLLLLVVMYAAADAKVHLAQRHWSPIFPVMLLLPLWGWCPLRPRGPLPLRGLLVGGILVGGVFTTIEPYSLPYHAVCRAWVVEGRHIDALADLIMEGPDPETPTLLMAPFHDTHFPFCKDHSALAGWSDCQSRWSAQRKTIQPSFETRDLHGRPFAKAYSAPDATDYDRLFSDPRWAGREFMVFTSRGCPDRLAEVPDAGDPAGSAIDFEACALLMETPSALLFRCPPFYTESS